MRAESEVDFAEVAVRQGAKEDPALLGEDIIHFVSTG